MRIKRTSELPRDGPNRIGIFTEVATSNTASEKLPDLMALERQLYLASLDTIEKLAVVLKVDPRSSRERH